MARKIAWNEALEAYNVDLDVLEMTRNDYIRFVSQTTDDVAERVKALSGGKIDPCVRPEKELDSQLDPIVEWWPEGTRGLGGLGVQAFPVAGRSHTSGAFFVELWLDTDSPVPCEFGVPELQAGLLDEVAGLPGETYDPAKHHESQATVVDLRLVGVSFSAADLVEQLAQHFLTYIEAANRLTDHVVLAPRATDPNRWARVRLLEVREMLDKEVGGKGRNAEWDPKSSGLGDWEDGRYIGIRSHNDDGEPDDLWVCAMDDGDVVFAAHGPLTDNKTRCRALMNLAKGKPRMFNDGPGATLFDASAIRVMAKDGNMKGFRDVVTALFREFLNPSR